MRSIFRASLDLLDRAGHNLRVSSSTVSASRISGFIAQLSPAALKQLGKERLNDLLLQELSQSRARVGAVRHKYPTAEPRELSQRLIDEKKRLGGVLGGVTGMFGFLSMAADYLILIPWLQLRLLADISTTYGVNLKAESARQELIDLFWYANGISPLKRGGPQVLGSVAGLMLARRTRLRLLGRAMPVAGAALTAYLNNKHLQAVGDEAVRHYEAFHRAGRDSTQSHSQPPEA